jgi:hypothetical protein
LCDFMFFSYLSNKVALGASSGMCGLSYGMPCLQAEPGLSTINNRLPSEGSAGTDLEARLVLMFISVYISPISLNHVRSIDVLNPPFLWFNRSLHILSISDSTMARTYFYRQEF